MCPIVYSETCYNECVTYTKLQVHKSGQSVRYCKLNQRLLALTKETSWQLLLFKINKLKFKQKAKC